MLQPGDSEALAKQLRQEVGIIFRRNGTHVDVVVGNIRRDLDEWKATPRGLKPDV